MSEQGYYEEAIRFYDKVLKIAPSNSIAALHAKGLALSNLGKQSNPGKYEEAIRCYDKVIELDPNNKAALIQ